MVQLYAYDLAGTKIFVEEAVKGVDYICMECQSMVRVRGGSWRQLHYYHKKHISCSQREKSLEHIAVQRKLVQELEEAKMEVVFPSIARIADVAWEKQKIVFEVQVSPMSVDELKQRIADYNSIGWQVLFILHTKTFGKTKVKEIEQFLVSHTHYFTDIDDSGGAIFDELLLIIQGKRIRLKALNRCEIDIKTITLRGLGSPVEDNLPAVIRERQNNWLYSAEGDLLSRIKNGGEEVCATISSEISIRLQKGREEHPVIRLLKNRVLSSYYSIVENCCS